MGLFRPCLGAFLLILLASTSGGTVFRAGAEPQIAVDTLQAGIPFTVDIYISDNVNDIVGYSLPFHFFSPDGSIDYAEHWNVGGFSAVTIGGDGVSYNDSSILMPNGYDTVWNMVNRWHGFRWDGVLPDTINHAAASSNGWPAGTDETLIIKFAFKIDQGGTFCIDSIRHPNSVYDWLFDEPASFGGPYCWQVICIGDIDCDGLADDLDNCPSTANPDQADSDSDGTGDVCDICPLDPDNDADGDGVCGDIDNCPTDYNPDQDDTDNDGAGTVCDNCPYLHNPDQADFDGDGIGDACDSVFVTWYVKADGGGDAPTIQAAIDSATHGDIILVAPGIYTGEGNRNIDFKGKFLRVVSEEGPYRTLIDCQGSALSESRAVHFHSGEDSNSILEGFTVKGGYLTSDDGAGICCEDFSRPMIRNCLITGNRSYALSNGAALFCDNSSPHLENCTIVGNYAENGGIIYFEYEAAPGLQTCIIGDNDGQAVTAGVTDNFISLECCDVYGNSGGDWVGAIADQAYVDGNLSIDPLFCEPSLANYHIAFNSVCNPLHNDCGVLIGALPTGCATEQTILVPDTVQSSWTGSSPTVTLAIYIGDILDGYTSNDISQATIRINGTITPTASQVMEPVAEFVTLKQSADILEAIFPAGGFINSYGQVFDTVRLGYAVSGNFTDGQDFTATGYFIMIGPGSRDINGDERIDLKDATYLLRYIYLGGHEPVIHRLAGDVDASGATNILDITYLINYLYRGGPPPRPLMS
nr:thrombospondin type 3 repeat-containing protein [candidate division Zixibacteria bacterium]